MDDNHNKVNMKTTDTLDTVSCPDRFFSFCVGAEKKKGLVDLQYIFCAAGSTTFGDRWLVVMNSKGLLTKQQ